MKLSNVLLPVLTTLTLACAPSKPDPALEKCTFIRKEIRDHLAELGHMVRMFNPNDVNTHSSALNLMSIKWFEGLITGEVKARDIFCPKVPDDQAVDEQIVSTFDKVTK